MRFLPVNLPFHSPYLRGVSDRIATEVYAGAELWSTEELAIEIFDRPVHWAKANDIGSHISHCVDFGTGGLSGIGGLTAANLQGRGVRVLIPSGMHRDTAEFYDLHKAFGPRLVKTEDGTLQIDTRFSRLLGRAPIMVPGMTPSTVGAGFNAAVLNAGYHIELAGGGHYNAPALRSKVAQIQAATEPGQCLTLNALFINPRQWAFQLPLWQEMRRESLPLQGLRFAAGIPSTENAIAGLRASARQEEWVNTVIGEQEALDLDILTHAESESSFFLSLCTARSSMPPHLPRDQPAFCHCSRCTMGGRSGKEVWAEVRQQHLARDIEDVRLAEFHGYMVDSFQTQAINANRAAIKKDLLELAAAAGSIDEEGSENSEFGPEEDIPLKDATPIHGLSPSASPPPLLFPEQVSPLAFAAEEDFGDALEGLHGAAGTADDRSEDEEENDEEEDDEEVANDEQEHGDDSSDDGLGDDDLSDVQDELEQEGGLFGGADGAESDTTQEEEEDEDDGAAGSWEASPASEDEADPRTTSRHSPDLFDRLVAGYTPGRKPRRPPNIHNSAAQLQSRLGHSEHASLAHFVTSIRTKATDDQYKAFARNAEKLSP
ncbi:fatty acid synthase alpha subunit Lsd1, partial [Tilletia horrida]